MTMMQFADVVVAGNLISVRDSVVQTGDGAEWRILTVDPSAVWKGKMRQAVRILCAWDCLPEFDIGGHYLFYASRKDGENLTGRCWRNNSFDAAVFDRYLLPPPIWLREIEPPVPVFKRDLVAALDHPDYDTAAGAAKDFGWLTDDADSLVAPLVGVLRSDSARRPQLAAVALAELGSPAPIPDLEWAYQNGEPIMAVAALTAIVALQPSPRDRVAAIRSGLAHESATVRYQAVNLFADEALRPRAGIGPAAASDELREMREVESDPDVVLRIDIRLGDLIEAQD